MLLPTSCSLSKLAAVSASLNKQGTKLPAAGAQLTAVV